MRVRLINHYVCMATLVASGNSDGDVLMAHRCVSFGIWICRGRIITSVGAIIGSFSYSCTHWLSHLASSDNTQGLQENGVHGLSAGIRRGMHGAVALPSRGFFDFITATANEARDSARLIAGDRPPLRHRPPAFFRGYSMPKYNMRASLGQYYLWSLSGTGAV